MRTTSRPLQNLHISFDEDDFQMVRSAFSGSGFSGKAPILAEYESTIARYFGVLHALACCNGTVAIELALRGAGMQKGHRIGLPATAPIMTILPILTLGCVPVFYDVTASSFAPELDDLSKLANAGLDAVITVPMWGYPWDMHQVAAFCSERNIVLIEDCAHSFGTKMDGQPFGTFGDVSAFSTHERKLVSTGEGGFCLTQNAAVRAQMRQWQHHGARLEPDGSERLGRAVGTNYKLAPLCAALGISQFAKLDDKIGARRRVVENLRKGLRGVESIHEMQRYPGSDINGYAMVFWHDGAETRDLTRTLGKHGIESDTTRYDYKPLYLEPAFREYARECPNAEYMIENIFTLPCHEGLSEAEQSDIAAVVSEVFGSATVLEAAQ